MEQVKNPQRFYSLLLYFFYDNVHVYYFMRHIITRNYVSGAVKRARSSFDIHTEIYDYLRDTRVLYTHILCYYTMYPSQNTFLLAIIFNSKQHSF